MTDVWNEHPEMQELLREERRWNMRARKLCMLKGHVWSKRLNHDIVCKRCSKWKGLWR